MPGKHFTTHPVPLFTKQKADLVKTRSREIQVETFPIALKFDRHLGSSDACQISERHDHYNIRSRGFETSRDLGVRRLTA